MIDLRKGLFVENQGFLIPWGITNEEAWRTGNPTYWNLPDDKFRMKWDGAVILDGLECVIQTWFRTKRLSELNILDAHSRERSPHDWADVLKMHCQRLFGKGTDQRSWQHDDVMIHLVHFDRFVEAYYLTIKPARPAPAAGKKRMTHPE
jgi:hypothetical protein